MFRRKRSNSSLPRPSSTTPNAAAALAASQAFLANRASNANLSASAAAAALRTHTTSPTTVGQIQTKRMQRRGSFGSNGSASARPGGLQRRDSNGSMTERTFREPSPIRIERPASSHGPYPKYEEEAPPPVPSLPQRYATPSPFAKSLGKGSRGVDLGQRISSPPPRIPRSRAVSLDAGPAKGLVPQDLKKRILKSGTAGEAHLAANQASSRASVNYSRPISPQNSPAASSSVSGRMRSPSPQVTTPSKLSVEKVDPTTSSPQYATQRPIKKKKKSVSNATSGEAHVAGVPNDDFSSNTLRAPDLQHRGQTTSQKSPPAKTVPSSEDNGSLNPSRVKKKKKKFVAGKDDGKRERDEGFGNAYPSDTDSVISDVSSTTDRPRTYNTRAAGILAKQPSIVREDREGEEQAEHKLSSASIASQNTLSGAPGSGILANTSKVVSKERQHIRSASQPDTHEAKILPSLEVPTVNRQTSLSPTRAAHFSAQPSYETIDGTKHQPLGRSVSPAKSALKHSPSRGKSPLVQRNQGLAPSEASDTSGLSDEGRSSSSKKKKGARVSFEENSIIAGHATNPVTTDSPVMMSPQNKARTAAWLGSARDHSPLSSEPNQEEEDTSIKPTPALPSFGSIRNRKERSAMMVDDAPSATNEEIQRGSRDLGTSSDHGIGAILQDTAVRQGKEIPAAASNLPNQPLPPDTTSAKGIGSRSDEGSFSEHAPISIPHGQGAEYKSTLSQSTSIEARPIEESTGSVPVIAVMPATPGVDESLVNRDSWLGMPGGFPKASNQGKASPDPANVTATENTADINKPDPVIAESRNDRPATASSTEHPSPVITPATLGIAEPEPEAVAALHEPGSPHVGEVAETLRTQIDSHSGEESADDGSIYSDAAEDQVDVEGDGFGSINAIVESPASPSFSATSRSPPTSPTPKTTVATAQRAVPPHNQNEVPEPAVEESWGRAQAYWSGLSHTRRQQLEQAALPGAVDVPVLPDRTMRGKESMAKKKKKSKKLTSSSQQIEGSQPGRSENLAQAMVVEGQNVRDPNTTPMRRNLKENPDSGTDIRKSTRDSKPLKTATEEGSYGHSIQTAPAESKTSLQKKNRPVSAVPIIDYKLQAASTSNHKRATSTTSPVTNLAPAVAQHKTKSAPKSNPIRSKSDGSDSDSSFKRMRSSTPDTGKYTMKRTMRGTSAEAGSTGGANRANSLNMRGASPAGSGTRRHFSSVGPTVGGGGGRMRTSMRDSIGSAKPARMSLRNSMDSGKAGRTKSPSRFGFGLGSKSKSVDIKPSSKATASRSSRFQDSSDDEDELPTMASSRFADSSDEEPALAPVRGIPRRIEEGDSTDLEDSSTDNVHPRLSGKSNDTQPTTVSVPSTKPEGAALASGSLRTPSGGNPPTNSMGSGLQAKKAAEKEKNKKKRSFFGVLGSKRKDESYRVPKPDIESAARRDTPLEGNREERKLNTATPQTASAATSTPTSIKVTSPSQQIPAQASPKSPKLQRRHTPKRLTSLNENSPWPLQQSRGGSNQIVSAQQGRPNTSDGAGPSSPSVTRPDLGDRRLTGRSTTTEGKKKRFPMLRKAFGLQG